MDVASVLITLSLTDLMLLHLASTWAIVVPVVVTLITVEEVEVVEEEVEEEEVAITVTPIVIPIVGILTAEAIVIKTVIPTVGIVGTGVIVAARPHRVEEGTRPITDVVEAIQEARQEAAVLLEVVAVEAGIMIPLLALLRQRQHPQTLNVGKGYILNWFDVVTGYTPCIMGPHGRQVVNKSKVKGKGSK